MILRYSPRADEASIRMDVTYEEVTMYGTVARMRVKHGEEARLLALMKDEGELQIPGFLGYVVYRMDKDARELYLAVIFADKESYVANADSPEQDALYRKMVALLEGEPEWHDGEIVDAMMLEGHGGR